MKEIELRRCPFCGAEYSNDPQSKGTVKLIKGVTFYWVVCLNCGTRTGECFAPEEAAKIWNRRDGDGRE